jgi:hypothetical protein
VESCKLLLIEVTVPSCLDRLDFWTVRGEENDKTNTLILGRLEIDTGFHSRITTTVHTIDLVLIDP